jgi:glycosyltransferase involved in cell wall biosynthesis
MDNTETPPRLSVIIPCLNEANYVSKLLSDLANQDIDEPFEVIVADSSSDDNTLEVAEKFSNRLNLKTTNTDRMSAGHTRNAGAEIASGEYFLFTDADGQVKPGFLRTVMAIRDEHNNDMISSKMRVEGWHPFDKVYTAFTNYWFRQSFDTSPRMSGMLQFTTADIHNEVNGYRDELTVGEDVDYSERVAEVATNPHFIDKALVTTSKRRLKADGRLTMFLRASIWNGAPPINDERANIFNFGHYEAEKSSIKMRELLSNAEVRRAFVAAIKAYVQQAIKQIKK